MDASLDFPKKKKKKKEVYTLNLVCEIDKNQVNLKLKC